MTYNVLLKKHSIKLFHFTLIFLKKTIQSCGRQNHFQFFAFLILLREAGFCSSQVHKQKDSDLTAESKVKFSAKMSTDTNVWTAIASI